MRDFGKDGACCFFILLRFLFIRVKFNGHLSKGELYLNGSSIGADSEDIKGIIVNLHDLVRQQGTALVCGNNR